MAETMTLLPRAFRVRHRRRELNDTYTLTLEPGEGPPLGFAAGQYNMIYVPGVGEVPISISGSPLEPRPLTHTIRAVGPVSRAICDLRKGQDVGIRGPYGTGWPMEQVLGRDLLLIGGGLGLAPLRPAILQVMAQRAHYGRVTLLIGARTPRDLLYSREIRRWRSRFDFDVQVTVDTATADWHGHVGVVTSLIPLARFEPDETAALVCGPEIMMRYCAAELLRARVAGEDIYVSLERNMKCALGTCGHCQFGPHFVCRDGPVFRYERIAPFLKIREV